MTNEQIQKHNIPVPIESIPVEYQNQFLFNEREIIKQVRREAIKNKCFVDDVLTEEICCHPLRDFGQKECWGEGYDFQVCCGDLVMRRPHVQYLYDNVEDFDGIFFF